MNVTRVRYRLLPDQCRVAIRATSNVHPIHGEATGLEGFVEVSLDGERPDLADQPKAEVRLAVADLSSGNSAYDTEMRRRLEARRFPSITGRLTGAAETGSPDTYRTEGDLTFHGVTRRVAVEIQASFDRQQLEASWQQTVDIRDFNLTSPRILMFKVDPHVEVEVQLRAEAERKEHE